MNEWYKDYLKEAGMMDSIKGLFTSKPQPITNPETEYIDKVVSIIKDYIDNNKDKANVTKEGRGKITMWVWGCSLLKSLMEETPWDKTDAEMIDNSEQMQLLDKRMKIVVEKLRKMGYDASIDYEGKSFPVDLEILL